MGTDVFYQDSETSKEVVGEGISRQILGYDEQIMMVKIWFEDGAKGYVHSHPHSQVTYVESGEFEVLVGDETRTVVGGNSFFMASNIEHGVVCLKGGVLIDVFSPCRDDFLQESH